MLSRLATTKKKRHHKSVMQIWLRQPSVAKVECLIVTETKTWMIAIIRYLEHGTCPKEKKAMKRQCSRYTMINQDLYRRGYSRPLLKCITEEQAEYVLKEIHEGVCGNHSKAQTMAAKVLRVDYYLSTVQGDCV